MTFKGLAVIIELNAEVWPNVVCQTLSWRWAKHLFLH